MVSHVCRLMVIRLISLCLAADPPDPHVEGPMDVVQDPPAETSSKSSAAPAKRPRTSTAGSTSAPPAESRQRTEAQAFDVPPSPDGANVGALRRSPSVPFSAAATPSTTASAANHQRQDARGDSPIVSHYCSCLSSPLC
jgi:hypothetical protein